MEINKEEIIDECMKKIPEADVTDAHIRRAISMAINKVLKAKKNGK